MVVNVDVATIRHSISASLTCKLVPCLHIRSRYAQLDLFREASELTTAIRDFMVSSIPSFPVSLASARQRSLQTTTRQAWILQIVLAVVTPLTASGQDAAIPLNWRSAELSRHWESETAVEAAGLGTQVATDPPLLRTAPVLQNATGSPRNRALQVATLVFASRAASKLSG